MNCRMLIAVTASVLCASTADAQVRAPQKAPAAVKAPNLLPSLEAAFRNGWVASYQGATGNSQNILSITVSPKGGGDRVVISATLPSLPTPVPLPQALKKISCGYIADVMECSAGDQTLRQHAQNNFYMWVPQPPSDGRCLPGFSAVPAIQLVVWDGVPNSPAQYVCKWVVAAGVANPASPDGLDIIMAGPITVTVNVKP